MVLEYFGSDLWSKIFTPNISVHWFVSFVEISHVRLPWIWTRLQSRNPHQFVDHSEYNSAIVKPLRGPLPRQHWVSYTLVDLLSKLPVTLHSLFSHLTKAWNHIKFITTPVHRYFGRWKPRAHQKSRK